MSKISFRNQEKLDNFEYYKQYKDDYLKAIEVAFYLFNKLIPGSSFKKFETWLLNSNNNKLIELENKIKRS